MFSVKGKDIFNVVHKSMILLTFDNALTAINNAIRNLCTDLIRASKQTGEQINKWR